MAKKAAKPKDAEEVAKSKLGRAAPEPLQDTDLDAHKGLLSRVLRIFVGKPRDILDPSLFRNLSLAAFLAWVGLGADGLSSSCYGPEEAFKALGSYHDLAVYLVVAVVATVFIISATYSQIIERFPSGGGGYVVASKLLGSSAGLVAGSALVVDYALTIAISVASGGDAVFSFLDPHWLRFKLPFVIVSIGLLVLLNLRGAKESVTILLPIFLTFILTHAFLILDGLLSHAQNFPEVMLRAATETHQSVANLGLFATGLLILKAYSLGGGTFTGIEAVSNGLPILAEPRVVTGKRTMKYMAISLAFTAGGILFCYMLFQIHEVPGRTFNAILFGEITRLWNSGTVPFGRILVGVSLVSEAALLFVAAQAGFLGGPQMLASMAIDSWMPHRFGMLSDRLVTRNGVLVMGTSALGFVLLTGGRVGILVVLYSINVFLTFSMAQLGMARSYWKRRKSMPDFRKKFPVMATGLCLTSFILVVTVSLKFKEGGWITVLITSLVIVCCVLIQRHYQGVRRFIASLNEALLKLPPKVKEKTVPKMDPEAPTAAILVSGYNGLGIHTLYSIVRLFPHHYRQFVFISVAIVDSEKFKGGAEVEALKENTKKGLGLYETFAGRLGLYAESDWRMGTDAAEEVVKMARDIISRFPRTVFFAGRLVFPVESFVSRLLHNETGFAIQRRLHLAGVPMVILPIQKTAAPGKPPAAALS